MEWFLYNNGLRHEGVKTLRSQKLKSYKVHFVHVASHRFKL